MKGAIACAGQSFPYFKICITSIRSSIAEIKTKETSYSGRRRWYKSSWFSRSQCAIFACRVTLRGCKDGLKIRVESKNNNAIEIQMQFITFFLTWHSNICMKLRNDMPHRIQSSIDKFIFRNMSSSKKILDNMLKDILPILQTLDFELT